MKTLFSRNAALRGLQVAVYAQVFYVELHEGYVERQRASFTKPAEIHMTLLSELVARTKAALTETTAYKSCFA